MSNRNVVLRGVARVGRWLLRGTLGLLGLVLTYVLAAWLIPYIPANQPRAEANEGEEVFVRSNGVHTDIILPRRTAVKDWSQELPLADTEAADSSLTHVAFGWGDKGFYLETKEWADLKASTAAKAIFGLSGTAMHIDHCAKPQTGAYCRRVRVDTPTLRALVASIASGFLREADGRPILIPGRHYDRTDAFYEATGRYSLFHSCNSWANAVLKEAHLPAALWTVTDKGILLHYPSPLH